MDEFRNYLFSKGLANDKNVSFYIMWVKKYLEFQKSSTQDDARNRNIDYFIKCLSNNYFDWQIDQANEAIQAYFLFQEQKSKYRLFRKSQSPSVPGSIQIPIPYPPSAVDGDMLQ